MCYGWKCVHIEAATLYTLTAHRRFKISTTIVLSKRNVRLHMKCEHERLFNRGDEKVAACSIARATRLSLDDSLYKQNTKKCMGARERATIAPFSPYVIHEGPLLVGVWSSANMLAIFLPNDVSSSNNKRPHIKCLIFVSDINPI